MAKIPYNEWAAKNNIPLDAAKKLLRRRFLTNPALKKRVEKKRSYFEQWFIDEDVRPIKTEGGKWELV